MASRQGIITGLKSVLSNISIVNGYNTDIGSNVDEWRLTPYSESDLPVIEIRDESCSITDGRNNVDNYKTLSVTISCYDSVTATGATEMRLYIKDVLSAIGKDPQLSGNALDIDVDSTSIEGSQDSDIIFSAVVNLSVGYITNKWSD